MFSVILVPSLPLGIVAKSSGFILTDYNAFSQKVLGDLFGNGCLLWKKIFLFQHQTLVQNMEIPGVSGNDVADTDTITWTE